MCVLFFFPYIYGLSSYCNAPHGKISENSVDFPSTVDNTIQVVIEDLILYAMTLKADVKTGRAHSCLQRVGGT